MKRSLLIVLFAALLGGCASTEVAHRYIDHTAVMTEEQRTSRLRPYSGATEIQATEAPFETMAAMADRGYFLLGEAVYANRGKLPRQQLAVDGAEFGADVVTYYDDIAGRLFRHDTAAKGGPTFQAFAQGNPVPSDGHLAGTASDARPPRYYVQFWRKAQG